MRISLEYLLNNPEMPASPARSPQTATGKLKKVDVANEDERLTVGTVATYLSCSIPE
jgi:hypothetical protein